MNSSQFEAGLVGTAAVTHTYSHTHTHTHLCCPQNTAINHPEDGSGLPSSWLLRESQGEGGRRVRPPRPNHPPVHVLAWKRNINETFGDNNRNQNSEKKVGDSDGI